MWIMLNCHVNQGNDSSTLGWMTCALGSIYSLTVTAPCLYPRFKEINVCYTDMLQQLTVGSLGTQAQGTPNDQSHLVLHPRDIDEPSPSYCRRRLPLCCQLRRKANDPVETDESVTRWSTTGERWSDNLQVWGSVSRPRRLCRGLGSTTVQKYSKELSDWRPQVQTTKPLLLCTWKTQVPFFWTTTSPQSCGESYRVSLWEMLTFMVVLTLATVSSSRGNW